MRIWNNSKSPNIWFRLHYLVYFIPSTGRLPSVHQLCNIPYPLYKLMCLCSQSCLQWGVVNKLYTNDRREIHLPGVLQQFSSRSTFPFYYTTTIWLKIEKNIVRLWSLLSERMHIQHVLFAFTGSNKYVLCTSRKADIQFNFQMFTTNEIKCCVTVGRLFIFYRCVQF